MLWAQFVLPFLTVCGREYPIFGPLLYRDSFSSNWCGICPELLQRAVNVSCSRRPAWGECRLFISPLLSFEFCIASSIFTTTFLLSTSSQFFGVQADNNAERIPYRPLEFLNRLVTERSQGIASGDCLQARVLNVLANLQKLAFFVINPSRRSHLRQPSPLGSVQIIALDTYSDHQFVVGFLGVQG